MSDWQPDAPVEGMVLWRHPSGAEKTLATTVKPGARRTALSRALQAFEKPKAAERARQANSEAKARKRADDADWREREQKANAEAMATRRATDPEWRDCERLADANAKAFEATRPQREAAERAARAVRQANCEAALEKAKRCQRLELQIELMDAAGLSSQPKVGCRGLVELLARVWACEWPVCVLGAPADLQMVESLDLDNMEYVMNLADHCSDYAKFVEALNDGDSAEWTADESDRVWHARARSIADADRQRFIGLTAAEAHALEDACVAWLDDRMTVDDDVEAGWVCQPIPKPPERYRRQRCCVFYDADCVCWGCRWVRGSPDDPEAAKVLDRSIRRCEREARAAEEAHVRAQRKDFATAKAEAKRALKRRVEEALAEMSTTARALSHAEDAQAGYFADMTEAERRENALRQPVVVRIQALARERRVRSLTRRLATERAEEAAAAAKRQRPFEGVPGAFRRGTAFRCPRASADE